MKTLYVLATPIGNLEDVSFRALKILKEADLILAEDPLKTKILLKKYKIETPLISYHQHVSRSKLEKIAKTLEEGKDLVLVSNAGTPGIQDPGNELIDFLYKRFKDLKTIPIPGPSALTAIASISGFNCNSFLFLGFLPKKRGRRTLLNQIKKDFSKFPIILFESPSRLIKTLDDLYSFLGNREIVIGRELTKKFEEIKRGKIKELIDYFSKKPPKGEITLIIKNDKAA